VSIPAGLLLWAKPTDFPRQRQAFPARLPTGTGIQVPRHGHSGSEARAFRFRGTGIQVPRRGHSGASTGIQVPKARAFRCRTHGHSGAESRI